MPNHAAGAVQHNVDEDDGQRDALADHAEQDEHAGETITVVNSSKSSTHKFADDEARSRRRDEAGARVSQQADGNVPGHGAKTAKKNHGAWAGMVLDGEPLTHGAPQDGDRRTSRRSAGPARSGRKVEVLEALHARPQYRSPNHRGSRPGSPGRLPPTTTRGRRAQVGERVLAARLARLGGDHQRQEDAMTRERSHDPEDWELDVPGAGDIVRQQMIDADLSCPPSSVR
ncbi:hypothetical protein [Nannocystis sp.]|uniref:hypothetical protein n=1 Tax=Nannocystis sp. TaxID=1962667 RepID=UPI0025E930C7|nr:hypothetical protein [Nannocystis sp.]MBK7830004.1 hypothetical protein [Nannocystis sp.]